MAMREHQGRPDSAGTAKLKLAGVAQSLRKIIVVLSKIPEYSSTPEMKNIVKSTHDPFIRLEKGLELFSEKYFSNFLEFSDTLTAYGSENCPEEEHCEILIDFNTLIKDVDLNLVWDPPWNKDMMSEAAKLELNI